MNSSEEDKYKDYIKPYYDPFQLDPNNLNDNWIILTDYFIKTMIGTLWVTVIYVSIRSVYLMQKIVRNQLKYDQLKEKWAEEIKLYEDPLVIKETNMGYQKQLLQFEDRYEVYDFREPKALYRYAFLFFLVICLTAFWLTIKYMRDCLILGAFGGCSLMISYHFYDKVMKQILDRIKTKLQIRQLDKEIEIKKRKRE